MNINDYATVILTDHGKKIVDDYKKNLEKEFGMKFDNIYNYDKNGKFRESIWVLMKIFGKYMYNGAEQEFLNNQIYTD